MRLHDVVLAFDDAIYGELMPASVKWYRAMLNQFMVEFGDSDVDVEEISPGDLRRWRREIVQRHATGTVNSRISAVKRLFSWCVQEGLLEISPARRLGKVKQDHRPKAIALDDVARLLDYLRRCRRWRDAAIVLFLLSTGCRVQGVIGLTFDRLDMDDGRALVVEKGSKARWVFLSPPAVDALRQYIELERPEVDDPHLFLSRLNKPLTRQAVWHMLSKAGDRLKIEHCHPHAFRHAFAINRLQLGDNLSSVSRLLGHTSIEVTHQYYAGWELDSLQKQHGQFDIVSQVLHKDDGGAD